MHQITTCSFFKLEGFREKIWGFMQMRLGGSKMKKVNGNEFFKFLGSGSGNGFSIIPNFNVYALLCVWVSEKQAEQFFNQSALYAMYKEKSSEIFTLYLKAVNVHGEWSGKQPFKKQADVALDKPIVVLTRASIKPLKLLAFWQKVGKVSASLKTYEHQVFSIGIGEWPLIQQATISVWKTQKQMLDYAYNNEQHQRVVQLTRELKWYREELFARFQPYKTAGTWNGKLINI